MKICNKCNLEQIEENFPFKDKKKGKRQNTCKMCHKIYVDNHYQQNKQVYKDKAKRNDKKYLDEFIKYKKSLNCIDCQISFAEQHWICDFHHIDRTTKKKEVSSIAKNGKQLREELKKCIPLCANCHRKRTYIENGGIV